jgi:hypothetical protein
MIFRWRGRLMPGFRVFGGRQVRLPRNAWRRFEKYDGFRADFAGPVLNAP